MISLGDFQPLKTNLFSSITGDFTERYFSDKVHAILIGEVPVQNTLRDGASFRFRRLTSLIGLKYLHQPSNYYLGARGLLARQRRGASERVVLVGEFFLAASRLAFTAKLCRPKGEKNPSGTQSIKLRAEYFHINLLSLSAKDYL